MNTFHRAIEAKEFVASCVIEEAQRDGVPLSELERKILYVSAPEMSEADEAVCSEFDESLYEQRIAALIKKVDRRYRNEDQQEFLRWRSAIQLLLKQDHYIGVMIARAKLRPRGDLFKLVGTAVLVVCILIGAIVLMDRWGIEPPTRQASAFWVWVTLLPLAVLYSLARMLIGSDPFERAVSWVSNRMAKITRGAE